MKMRKLTSVLMAVMMMLSMGSMSAFAVEDTSHNLHEIISAASSELEQQGFEVDVIHISDLPEGAAVIEINSVADYQAFLNEITSIEAVQSNRITVNPYLRASSTYTLDQAQVGFGGTVSLRCTAWYENQKFTDAVAFTQFTGFTYSFEWDETMCKAVMTHNNTNIDAYASGVIKCYILIPEVDFLQVYSYSIDLFGSLGW